MNRKERRKIMNRPMERKELKELEDNMFAFTIADRHVGKKEFERIYRELIDKKRV